MGFAGSIIIAPRNFGCTNKSKLRGYIHYWRVLGYLHGLDDSVNPFTGSVEDVNINIANMTFKRLVPALERPPDDFEHMSRAIGKWGGARNAHIVYGIHLMITNFSDQVKESLGVTNGRLRCLADLYPLVSFGEKLSFYMMYILYNYIYAWPFCRILINKGFGKI